MHRIALVVAVAALALSGCAVNSTNVELLKQVDQNFAGCDRHVTFNGGVGVVTPGVQVSGSIDCKGTSAPAPAVKP